MQPHIPAIQRLPAGTAWPTIAIARVPWRSALLGVGLCLSLLGGHAVAAPGVPAAPVLIWSEDFENPQTPPVTTDGRDLLQYVGANPAGQRYTADPLWQMGAQHCNGIIAAFSQNPASAAMTAACAGQVNWNGLQQMAKVAGLFAGMSDPAAQSNHAMAMLTTRGSFPVNSTAFRTVSNIPLAQSVNGRFFTASMDVVAMFCDPPYLHPLLRFSLVNDADTAVPLSASTIDACQGGQNFTATPIGTATAKRAVAQTVTSPGALLFSGSSVGFILHNDQTGERGNDAAIDNARILDVTPQLDKAFSPALITEQQTARLTLTITNTTDLLAKNGWAFTDNLPAGLVAAGSAGTTCAAGTVVDAPAGSASVTVTQGSLSQGAISCEVFVDVRPAGPGTFTNGAGNLALTGLNPPAAPAVLDVTPVADMQATNVVLPLNMTVGIPVTGSFTCKNAGPSPAVGASCQLTGLPAGAVMACTPASPTAVPLAAGATIDCTVAFTPVTTGAVTALLTAGSSTQDPMPANNTRAHPFDPTEPAADMQALAATLPPNLVVGTPASGSFSCRNAGPQAAAMATCAISGLPAGAAVACTPHVPTAVPQAPDSLISCTVTFTPTSTAALAVTVTASSSTRDPVAANNTWSANLVPTEKTADMQATAITLPPTVSAGTPVSGSFTCRNAGPDAAAAATCTISGLPAGAHVSCTPAAPTGTPLAPGAEISCTADFTPVVTAALTATVTAGSGNRDPEPANNTRSHAMNAAAQTAQAIPATGMPALLGLSLALLLAGWGLRRRLP